MISRRETAGSSTFAKVTTAGVLLGRHPSSNTRGYSGSNSSLYKLVFDHMDENRDGKISPAELQSCVRSAGGQLSGEEAEEAVMALDLDGDGLLGFEEFLKLMESNGDEEDKRNELKDAFEMYEMEGCGYITASSLKRTLSRLGESKSMDECRAMIDAFDLNGDGVLSFDEFSLMMR